MKKVIKISLIIITLVLTSFFILLVLFNQPRCSWKVYSGKCEWTSVDLNKNKVRFKFLVDNQDDRLSADNEYEEDLRSLPARSYCFGGRDIDEKSLSECHVITGESVDCYRQIKTEGACGSYPFEFRKYQEELK